MAPEGKGVNGPRLCIVGPLIHRHASRPTALPATIAVDMADTLADWLGRRFPTAKKQTLRRMIAEGRVTVNGRPATRFNEPIPADAAVQVDESQRVRTGSDASRGAGPDGRGRRLPKPDIIYEDADLLVVNKPAGLLTSTTPREPRPTLLAAVRAYVAAKDPRARVGLIHRLDRDAAGLLVFSKTDSAYHALKTQFFHHDVDRVYLAVTHGVPNPPKGRIETRLEERSDGTVHSTRLVNKGQAAVTDYEVIRTADRRALVQVTLQTGRKHQIRVHLRERGTPIVGDPVYGPKPEAAGKGSQRTTDATPQLLLAAIRLAITHPRTQERMTFQIPVPPAFEAAVPTRPAAS
jgi:23S rRNA pseudouridine1911/1915/1917 synthase